MKNSKRTIILLIIGGIGLIWAALTFVAEKEGKAKVFTIGETSSNQKALLVFDPDPFYNLDEQICKSFAEGLAKEGWSSKVSTVAAAKDFDTEKFGLYVFCANTYNWNPDKMISNYIKKHEFLKGKNVIAITLGSGSTKRSQRILEGIITQKEAKLIASKSFWLLKPNDGTRNDKSNIEVAVDMAFVFGKQTALNLQKEDEKN